MARTDVLDAVVVGSGPNGLVAAVELARAGHRVVVYEAASTPGGGLRTAELTEPGFRHDVCSAIHPLGVGSAAMRRLPLEEHGLRWIHPDIPLAHPVPGGAGLLHRSVDDTVEGLGVDGGVWRQLLRPFIGTASEPDVVHERGLQLIDALMAPLSVPRHPLRLARYGITGLQPATRVGRRFSTAAGAGLLAGLAAHTILPLSRPMTAGMATMMGALAHVWGWPMAEGGSQAIADALVSLLRAHGGEVVCDHRVADLRELPPSRVVLADVTPRQLLAMAGDRVPARVRRPLQRFRHGAGVFKIDYALSEPVPWTDPDVRRAGSVHVAGTLAEVAESEAAMFAGRHAERPFVLVVQPTLADPTRAPEGRHVLWAYCHVPAGSDVDMTRQIEAQIERFAPGFGDVVLARHVTDAGGFEAYNANYVGGDISAGVVDLRQFFARPRVSLRPWKVADGLYLCSGSTVPGPGVHGMCGYEAARLAASELS